MTEELRNVVYRWKYNQSKSNDEDGKKYSISVAKIVFKFTDIE